ncbi:MAG: hypothetical protein Q9162_005080 [Coniocarpon cinnabarinum]
MDAQLFNILQFTALPLPDPRSDIKSVLLDHTGAQEYRQLGPDSLLLNKEPRRCVLDTDMTSIGSELGLQGRFSNNALEPTLKAFEQIKRYGRRELNEVFAGDGIISKIKPPNNLVPDLVICNHAYAPVCVGEMKTFWPIESLKEVQNEFDADVRTGFYGHALGQLFLYMHDYGSQYGFLSTYAETIFVRFTAAIPGSRSASLARSPILEHSGSPFALPMGNITGINRCGQSLPLKQIILCFMLIAGLSKGPGKRMNYDGNAIRDWIKEHKNNDSVLGKRTGGPSGGTGQVIKPGPPPAGSGTPKFQRPHQVLVPPEKAWALRVAGTAPKKYQICVPGRGWTRIEVR